MSKKHWPFVAAVALQALIVIGVPAGRVYTHLTGRTVFLKTAPIDPYDIMSGYHVALSYEISNKDQMGLPYVGRGDSVYVVLREGEDGFWHVDAASGSWPKAVAPDAVVIKGRYQQWRIEYGIESYFVPEGKGPEIEAALRGERGQARVEAKVDAFGNAALVRLHVGGRTYDY
jgi:uncharacterized membrane-anchored protein